MSARTILVAVGAFAALQSPFWARADTFPFSITSASGRLISVECAGPWGRVSLCQKVTDLPPQNYTFYWADDTLFSAMGTWWCAVYSGSICNTRQTIAQINFCGPGAGNSPSYVDLTLDERTLTVNQAASCTGTVVKSVLGQNGEDDASPARDSDTFRFAGKPGENVEVKLGRDGSGGSAGEVATLSVRAANGAVLGQRTGAVPLSLGVTLPGTVEIAVSRQPGHGDPLRGYYELEVIPPSGDIGERKLRPTANVEH